jgi:mRNA interferase RelE/StbE
MYQIIISESALKQLRKIQKPAVKKIGTAIDSLSENPRPVGNKKLKGTQEGLYRIRIGDYRVIYAIEDKIQVVDIRQIGHRKDIYR